MTITAKFRVADLKLQIKEKIARSNTAILNAYKYAGETFVGNARRKTALEGGFNDITGNLRSSIGYVILQDGEMITENFAISGKGTAGQIGVVSGSEFATEIAALYPKGLVLICVAGMGYAAAVEAKHKDVITGSSLEMQDQLKQLIQQLG